MSLLRAARAPAASASTTFFRSNPVAALRQQQHQRLLLARSTVLIPGLLATGGSSSSSFSTSAARRAEHHEESFEEFSQRFEKEFEGVTDVFELQRNLNNCFAYDLVPSPSVISAALRAARRVNDFPTAVRIFEGIKNKVENRGQYEQYLEELKPLREEFGVLLKEDMYPDDPKNWKTMT